MKRRRGGGSGEGGDSFEGVIVGLWEDSLLGGVEWNRHDDDEQRAEGN